MPEYVYALHDFQPEHEDEVSFRAGDRIEVIERDEMYGDGWWKGRNLEDKVGLFPQSYTTPAPPPPTPAPASEISDAPSGTQNLSEAPKVDLAATSSTLEIPNTPLQTLKEESETASTAGADDGPPTKDNMMRATMTDVQKAIEQLGRRSTEETEGDDKDGGLSFSWASSRDGETDTDEDQAEGQEWHKGARRKLAEVVAQRRMEMDGDAEAERQREIERRLQPPIDAELSEESEGEEDEDQQPHKALQLPSREHPRIAEEEEGEDTKANDSLVTAGTVSSSQTLILNRDREDAATTTTQKSFIDLIPTPTVSTHALSATQAREPTPNVPNRAPTFNGKETSTTPLPSATQNVLSVSKLSFAEKPSTNGGSEPHHLPTPQTSKHSSLSSALTNEGSIDTEASSKKSTSQPADWTVDEVADWLKSKGFDQDVCSKFAEQEITGDVLLELDVNLLKSEIGITAYGKRARIANAITDLRRPPSVMYSDTQSPVARQNPYAYASSQAPASSLQGYAHSAPVSGSMQHSPGLVSVGLSPLAAPAYAVGPTGIGMGMVGPESPMAGTESSAISASIASTEDGAGLGFALSPRLQLGGRGEKIRPAQLTISPSDSNLTSKPVSSRATEAPDEDRGVISESEAPSSSTRRRLFGRSESSSSKDKSEFGRNSKEIGYSPKRSSSDKDSNASPGSRAATVGARHIRSKRSVDVAKPSDRLSLFGGALMSGSLGKSRKPAPRYSSFDADSPTQEKEKSGYSLSRSSKEMGDDMLGDPSSPGRLRKRSIGDSPSNVELKAGQSILVQIGTPDHAGFMRKKGERYNNWRHRYFVLKGVYLYCLRSDSEKETKIKGYVNLTGYKVIADENLDPGRYAFKIVHDNDKPHFFSSDEQLVVREWMKAIMKTSIERDYSRVVVSSCIVPTIPLVVAQTMNPSPRPPSPTARAATQRAMRRENPNQLSSRDARVLMGLPPPENGTISNPSASSSSDRPIVGSVFSSSPAFSSSPVIGTPRSDMTAFGSSYTVNSKNPIPPRPNRDQRKVTSSQPTTPQAENSPADDDLVQWANSHLSNALRMNDLAFCSGLMLLRIAESIKGRPSVPPVPDSAFPLGPGDDRLDGLFRLFDFLLDNDVKMGSVSINDVRQGKREKLVQLLKALRAWEDKKTAITQTLSKPSPTLNGTMGWS